MLEHIDADIAARQQAYKQLLKDVTDLDKEPLDYYQINDLNNDLCLIEWHLKSYKPSENQDTWPTEVLEQQHKEFLDHNRKLTDQLNTTINRYQALSLPQPPTTLHIMLPAMQNVLKQLQEAFELAPLILNDQTNNNTSRLSN